METFADLNSHTVLETGRPLPTCPTVFTKPGPAIADHGEAIPIPKIAQEQCDYEGELVVVIGKDAKNVKSEDALDFVAAYTCGNDVSAHDWQREAGKAGPVPQWSFSKSFDKYAPLGPCLVAAHILGAAEDLSLKTLVNGQARQESNTADLCFGVKALIEFCSQGQTLQKGSSVVVHGSNGDRRSPTRNFKVGVGCRHLLRSLSDLHSCLMWVTLEEGRISRGGMNDAIARLRDSAQAPIFSAKLMLHRARR